MDDIISYAAYGINQIEIKNSRPSRSATPSNPQPQGPHLHADTRIRLRSTSRDAPKVLHTPKTVAFGRTTNVKETVNAKKELNGTRPSTTTATTTMPTACQCSRMQRELDLLKAGRANLQKEVEQLKASNTILHKEFEQMRNRMRHDIDELRKQIQMSTPSATIANVHATAAAAVAAAAVERDSPIEAVGERLDRSEHTDLFSRASRSVNERLAAENLLNRQTRNTDRRRHEETYHRSFENERRERPAHTTRDGSGGKKHIVASPLQPVNIGPTIREYPNSENQREKCRGRKEWSEYNTTQHTRELILDDDDNEEAELHARSYRNRR